MQQRASLLTLNHSDQICTQTYTGKTLGITSMNVIKRTLPQMGPKQGQTLAFMCSYYEGRRQPKVIDEGKDSKR